MKVNTQNSVIDQLGIKYRDYLKISWRFVKTFKTIVAPASLTFIVNSDKLDAESMYYLIIMEKNAILLIQDRDNVTALYDFAHAYSDLYKRNTNLSPPTSYIQKKKPNGVAVEVAFYLQSIDEKYGNVENEFNPTPDQLSSDDKSKTDTSPSRKKLTVDRTIKKQKQKPTVNTSHRGVKVKPIKAKKAKFTKTIRRKKVI